MTTANGRPSDPPPDRPDKNKKKAKPRPGGGSKSRRGGGRPKGPGGGRGGRPSTIGLRRVEEGVYELVHPPCVDETELDYEEGIELWRAGEPEAARDALRYALEGCRDNLWLHAALGDIALHEYGDPRLARGHYGYAVDLAERALPPNFSGRLDGNLKANKPFVAALVGLIASLEALGRGRDARELEAMLKRLT